MRPNLFFCPPRHDEDFFSLSVAYLTTLLPDLGDKLVQRIAALAGQKAGQFGAFEGCEFVGQEFLEDHASSRPDLELRCSNGTIYFENKIDSPLSLDQMQRHSVLTSRDAGSGLVFVSNIQYPNPALRTLPGYIHPEGRDHYVWIDFLPAFENIYPEGSLPWHIVADFHSALRMNGMVGRNLRGANDSLYTRGSDAEHAALAQLWDVMHEVGFELSKRPRRESTIRAYPVKHGQHPLLNPRFSPIDPSFNPVSGPSKESDRECLVISVLSKAGETSLETQLVAFRSTPECTFLASPYSGRAYHQHGYFVLPLHFVGEGTSTEIDFAAVRQQLAKILSFLKDVARPARSGPLPLPAGPSLVRGAR